MIVGYTSGVFDLFHIGHLNLLKMAKAHCEYLIVAVTTDELSIEFNGKRPVICFNDRFAIVEAIRYVDKVVPQFNMDKYHAWDLYRFNVMFASENPTAKWPQVEKEFLAHFTNAIPPKIIRLPYTPNVSSTSIKEKLQRNI